MQQINEIITNGAVSIAIICLVSQLSGQGVPHQRGGEKTVKSLKS